MNTTKPYAVLMYVVSTAYANQNFIRQKMQEWGFDIDYDGNMLFFGDIESITALKYNLSTLGQSVQNDILHTLVFRVSEFLKIK